MLRSPNKKAEAVAYANWAGFNIKPARRGYTISHPEMPHMMMVADNYADALERMTAKIGDGGKPDAIEAAGKSVGEQQAEFDKLVADVKAPVWVQQSGRGTRTLLIGAKSRTDQRQFRVTVRYKGGSRVSFVCDTRDEAFESAGAQLTNKLVKSVKLEPM
jgi:hypothetical protein